MIERNPTELSPMPSLITWILQICRSITDNWNMQTHHWIKYVCYDRCPSSIRWGRVQLRIWRLIWGTQEIDQATFFLISLALSYIIIALWHGFYPGYWISFVQAAVLTKTSRVARRVIRPLFLSQGETYNTLNPGIRPVAVLDEARKLRSCIPWLPWLRSAISSFISAHVEKAMLRLHHVVRHRDSRPLYHGPFLPARVWRLHCILSVRRMVRSHRRWVNAFQSRVRLPSTNPTNTLRWHLPTESEKAYFSE